MNVLISIWLFTSYVINAQSIPNSVTLVKAYQMSPKVMFLKWDKPASEYVLTHYDIQFSEIQNGYIDTEDYLCSVDGNDNQVRLPALSTYQSYRIYIYSIFTNIASKSTMVDIELKGVGNYVPSKPDFVTEVDKSTGVVKVIWTPNSDFPGDSFYVNYKLNNESDYRSTNTVTDKFDLVIDNLKKEELYLFYVVACYGNAQTKSIIKEIDSIRARNQLLARRAFYKSALEPIYYLYDQPCGSNFFREYTTKIYLEIDICTYLLIGDDLLL